MATNYIEIESVSEGSEKIVKQDLKFKTGKFVWRVKFTAPLNPATVNNTNLYVTSGNGEVLETAIRYDAENNMIEIEPRSAYAENQSYILNVTTHVESRGGQRLKNNLQLKFKV